MLPTVQILPQTLINQIAAGEVIVRPASVIKELVENSLDAGATRVRVEISQDARDITIIDNGCGMDETNARIAILRHSTSKIRTFDDLERISTRGFRGEAVASIIAVSRFELLTQPHDALAGTRLIAAGGKVERVESCGTAPGTTLHVRDLFFNTPARLKFLKSAASEFGAAVEILTQQALSRPDVGFAIVRAGEVRFDLPSGQTPQQRVESLLGSAVHGMLLPVEFERGDMKITGFICRPEAARKDRRWQYLQINGRPIAARQLSHPIQQAYQGLLMKQRFPVLVLNIEMNLAEVDVNVHPTKEEVRFEDEHKVAGTLYRAVNQTLISNNLVPTLEGKPEEAAAEAQRPTPSPAPVAQDLFGAFRDKYNSAEVVTSADSAKPSGVDWANATQRFNQPQPAGSSGAASPRPNYLTAATTPYAQRPLFVQTTQSPAESIQPPFLSPASTQPTAFASSIPAAPTDFPLPEGVFLRALAQVADNTYILAASGDDLVLIDQHAAHERVLYKRLCNAQPQQIATQPQLIPLVFNPAASDSENLVALLPVLAETGVEMTRQPDGSYSIDALPSDLDTLDVEGMLQDSLDDLRQRHEPGPPALELLREKVRIYAACHAAIKGGQPLSMKEMQGLLRDLLEIGPPFRCPHGRPALIVWKKDALDRMFGRRQ
ncbi:TPA: DNA mismatch repair endonuclease MutL [Candidatus Sumerlaeota bacterium]|jgi:DNA mismatch repair protein MutL|nr:DNA mismatch repair endonuclease MutL [Candidatus Sumerlaeota bacterium]